MPHFFDPTNSLTRRALLGRSARAWVPWHCRACSVRATSPALPPPTRVRPQPRRGWTGVVSPLHFPPKAKRVIWLYMAGGMSHLETFDYKPKLAELHGKPMPESITKGQQIAQLQGQQLNCFGPQHEFKQYGQSGQQISSIFPLLGEQVADQMCIVRSLHTEAINHDPAHTFMNTGSMISGRPAAGSWLLYGLGSETEELPGFVVMVSTGKFGQKQPIAARQWHSGFLPSRFQGVEFRSTGDPVLYVGNPPGSTSPGSATWSTPCRSLTGSRTKRSTIPRLPPGSVSTKWPSGCNRACRA